MYCDLFYWGWIILYETEKELFEDKSSVTVGNYRLLYIFYERSDLVRVLSVRSALPTLY